MTTLHPEFVRWSRSWRRSLKLSFISYVGLILLDIVFLRTMGESLQTWFEIIYPVLLLATLFRLIAQYVGKIRTFRDEWSTNNLSANR